MPKPVVKHPAVQFKVTLAATLIYAGYRLLGATREHAWNRAKADIGNAILDKTVEKIGIVDPRHKGKAGLQAFFERGPLDGETRFVDECGGVLVPKKDRPSDAHQHWYIRTNRMRGQQTIFLYQGLEIPADRVSAMKIRSA